MRGYLNTNFSISKNFYKCFDFSGGQKVLQKWSSFLKKYIVFSFHKGVGRGWGGQTQCNKCYFFFYLKASLNDFHMSFAFDLGVSEDNVWRAPHPHSPL